MTSLPVIVGMGGINASGRTSFHQGFRRIVLDLLSDELRQETYLGLACLMKLVRFEDGQLLDQQGNPIQATEIESKLGEQVLAGTLIRKIEKEHFDPDATYWQQKTSLSSENESLTFTIAKKDLPRPLPASWSIQELTNEANEATGTLQVSVAGSLDVLLPSTLDNPIKAAGQLPTGFDPASLYNSHHQPRGLQNVIFGATDAIRSTGIDWQDILNTVNPDQIGTYSSSTQGQLHDEGLGNAMQGRLKGKRVGSKNAAMSLNTAPSDFINAYVTGNVGSTISATGACASFLYNLKAAVHDIQSGKIRAAIVGNSDALIVPEAAESFGNMGALANEKYLKMIGGSDTIDYTRTSRPFGENCGFTLGEGAQYFILMDDALALELGANVLGAAADVFVNADGVKKSITSPGPGNYISMAKAVALATNILGEKTVQQDSFILAHGSSTPQNRTTESHIFHTVAETFGIENWPVTAPKAYLGHSLGPASGDQLAWALGIFEHDIMPGITTIDKVADDVFTQHLNISTTHETCAPKDVAFINSKGFGGNNATAVIFSPKATLNMMAKRHGEEAIKTYQEKLEATKANQNAYREQANLAQFDLFYRFGEGMIDAEKIEITKKSMTLPGYANPISLDLKNPFEDMV
ncbi:beta-ketoacyl synthase [Litoribacillus peritrichatus]|uniref:Beta-ketoacyl-ACP synthase FabY n=1 Tax=Litoribacillus peritrichatus TaxID=718191 RepID=A0ABP7MKY0_9GAMM